MNRKATNYMQNQTTMASSQNRYVVCNFPMLTEGSVINLQQPGWAMADILGLVCYARVLGFYCWRCHVHFINFCLSTFVLRQQVHKLVEQPLNFAIGCYRRKYIFSEKFMFLHSKNIGIPR